MDTLGERAEKELDCMIERRVRNGETDPEEREELWQRSVRAYNARRREEARAAWREYHLAAAGRLRTVLEALAEGHEAAAARLQATDRKETA